MKKQKGFISPFLLIIAILFALAFLIVNKKYIYIGNSHTEIQGEDYAKTQLCAEKYFNKDDAWKEKTIADTVIVKTPSYVSFTPNSSNRNLEINSEEFGKFTLETLDIKETQADENFETHLQEMLSQNTKNFRFTKRFDSLSSVTTIIGDTGYFIIAANDIPQKWWIFKIVENNSSFFPKLKKYTDSMDFKCIIKSGQFSTQKDAKSLNSVSKIVKVGDVKELRKAISTTATSPKVEAFIFADLTEKGFSGRVLTENVSHIRDLYKEDLKIYYIHSVLAYRNTKDLLISIPTINCLGKEGSFWNNIDKLVEYSGYPDKIYDTKNDATYSNCMNELVGNTEFLEGQIKWGQELMKKNDIIGIPTALFINPKQPKTAIEITGVTPKEIYQYATQQILLENK